MCRVGNNNHMEGAIRGECCHVVCGYMCLHQQVCSNFGEEDVSNIVHDCVVS